MDSNEYLQLLKEGNRAKLFSFYGERNFDKLFNVFCNQPGIVNILEEINNSYSHNRLGYMYWKGLGVEKDYIKARYHLELAGTDNCYAQIKLGIIFLDGLGCKRDYNKAFICFNNAENMTYAKSLLAQMYYIGDGTPRNVEKAYRYCLDSSNEILSKYVLGMYYLNEKGDFQKALHYFRESLPISNYLLGFMYNNGFGVNRDTRKAFDYFVASLKTDIVNLSESKKELGNLYMLTSDPDKYMEDYFLNLLRKGEDIKEYNLFNWAIRVLNLRLENEKLTKTISEYETHINLSPDGKEYFELRDHFNSIK